MSTPLPACTLAVRELNAEHLDAPLTILHGAVPTELRGTFYRNGPATHAPRTGHNHHWFDGDGMVQAFLFTDAGVHHHGRFVATHKRETERAAGAALYPTFGDRPARAWPSMADERNVANTSVLPHHGRLLALWEGGSAHDLDPESLNCRGPVTWSADTAGEPFSAHPCVEPDGTMWNFGMRQASGDLLLYEIAPTGSLRRTEAVPLPDGVPMVHDFAVTQRHLLFLLPPFVFSGERFMDGASFLDAHVWQPEAPMRVLVVDKADWDHRRWFELPAGFTFHLGGAWDDGDTVRLDDERYPDPSIVTRFARDIVTGRADPLPPNEAMQIVLDLRQGSATQTRLALSSEFPTLHPGRVGRRYRYRYAVASDGAHGHPFQNGLRRIDLDTGATQFHSFGADTITEEHVVVPKPDGRREDDAWLVGTVLDTARQITRLTVFDATRIAAGPVLDAALPYALPLGFHGEFAAA